MELRKASRKKAKIRLGLSAVSGGGKTYSSILIAKGLCGDLSKVAIIDTENNSADLYAHLGDYNVLPISAPFAPEKYIEAIQTCEKAGMEVIIIDSISHEWDGKGGCLEIVEAITQGSASKNSYTAWAKVTPRHNAFIDAMLHSSAHIITTVRRKQDYEMSKENGKTKVEKAGLKEITREGWEYELTVNLQLDTAHQATASKDRTGLFMGKPEFVPGEETGHKIAKWCDEGIDAAEMEKAEREAKEQAFKEVLASGIKEIKKAKSIDQLKEIKSYLPKEVILHPDFKEVATEKFNSLTPQLSNN
jgi:hypothetical protein